MSPNAKLVLRDTIRHAVLIALGVVLAVLPMKQATSVVFYFLGVMAIVGTGAHILRRVFFPHIRMDDLADDARQGNVASAVIFASVTLFVCTIFLVAALLLGIK